MTAIQCAKILMIIAKNNSKETNREREPNHPADANMIVLHALTDGCN